MCFAGFGGVYAVVSIVWFATFYMHDLCSAPFVPFLDFA